MFIRQKCLHNLPHSYDWLHNEITKSNTVIEKKGFPCIFGVQGHKQQVHCYSVLNYPYSAKELSNDIDDYLLALKQMSSKESGLSGLLVYFEPIGPMNIHTKQFLCWHLLNENNLWITRRSNRQ